METDLVEGNPSITPLQGCTAFLAALRGLSTAAGRTTQLVARLRGSHSTPSFRQAMCVTNYTTTSFLRKDRQMSNAADGDVYTAYFKGVCDPNGPGGKMSYGVIIYRNGKPVWKCADLYVPESGNPSDTSNNMAEYAAFIAVLEWFDRQRLWDEKIIIRGDSQIVINQMFKGWGITGGRYVPLAQDARKWIGQFTNMRGESISKDQNAVAGQLARAV